MGEVLVLQPVNKPGLPHSIRFVSIALPSVHWLDWKSLCWALLAPMPWLLVFSLVLSLSASTSELLFILENPTQMSPPVVSLSDCPGPTSVLS